MFHTVLFFLFLSSCHLAQHADFVGTSPCGAVLEYNLDEVPVSNQTKEYTVEGYYRWDKEHLAIAERYVLDAFFCIHPPNFMTPAQLCKRLHDIRITQEQVPVWKDVYSRSLAGLTDCYQSEIFIGTGPFESNAFAHELAHVAQNCNAPKELDPGRDPAHSNWDSSGIQEGIDMAQAHTTCY